MIPKKKGSLASGLLFWWFALILMGCADRVWGFAEEPIGFRDPAGGTYYDPGAGYPEISTIHDDLFYTLALAAGFSEADSRRLQIWNQLVDSEALPPAYTNCGGSFAPPPDPADLYPGCRLNGTCANLIWPQWGEMQNPGTCITSRFGPFSPFFHFPHRTGPLADRDMGALREWAWGRTQTLVAYEAYAWGRNTDLTVVTAQYRYVRSVTVATAIGAGSLEAFATYLHALADSYSHQDCIAEMDAAGLEWATHTAVNDYPACKYNPGHPQPDDVHGKEFGPTPESQRTVEAARAVYQELAQRSLSREGLFFPLPLTTPLNVDGTLTTLEDAITAFIQNWAFAAPGPLNRRDYADKLAAALAAQPRIGTTRTYLPLVIR